MSNGNHYRLSDGQFARGPDLLSSASHLLFPSKDALSSACLLGDGRTVDDEFKWKWQIGIN